MFDPDLVKIRLRVGAERPFSVLHAADAHLTLADERDDERKRELAVRRAGEFETTPGDGIRRFEALLAHARRRGLPLLFTGDLIDFVSVRNLEYLAETLADIDCFMAVGNHEFSKYVGEAWEDEAYKMDSFDRVQAAFGNDLRFAARSIHGVNFVAIDNSYYLFAADAADRLRAEADKGQPIVLALHNPLYTEALFRERTQARGAADAALVGCPDTYLSAYNDHRRRQQTPDRPTRDFLAYLAGETRVKAILAGHLHFPFSDNVFGRLPQIVAGACYAGQANEVEFL